MTDKRDFAAELLAARRAKDWAAHTRIWEERRAADVERDEREALAAIERHRSIVRGRATARLAVQREAIDDWHSGINNANEYASRSHLYYAYVEQQAALAAALEFRLRTTPADYE